MSARIRLQRRGKKKQPFYRISVVDRSASASGGCIESLGFYNPEATGDEHELQVNRDRALKWLADGAQPTGTVRDLFNRFGILEEHEQG